MANILELSRINHAYTGRFVLSIPHLEIEEGSIVGLSGPNGSGKTTLLKLMSFMEKSRSGQICFRGRPAEPFAGEVRSRVSLLTQEPYLLKRSVFDNIAYGLRLRGEKNGLAGDVTGALALVGLPASFAGRQWFELSGGEAQRVALAARLVLKPDCLLLDEPTASVDAQSAGKIRQAILLARREWGTTLIMASHNRYWLYGICDRLVFLHNGRLLAGGLENVLYGPWQDCRDGRSAKRLTDGQLIYLPDRPQPEGSAAISAEEIVFRDSGPGGEGINQLQGVIRGIFLENTAGKVRAQVLCGDQLFLVDLADDLMRKNKWLPGQQVTLRFPVKSITLFPAG
jgi:tungstate transport system ATP-binding protein